MTGAEFRKGTRPSDIILDETILLALRKELDACEHGDVPDAEPEALLLAWCFIHYRQILETTTLLPPLDPTALALALAEATIRVRAEAIEIIKPHCEAIQ